MPVKASDDDPEKARRFREAALPYLDDAYTLARYLLRDAADAEDAVQECYLRAFKHFDSYRGPAMKPWLFAILRNVCRAEYARRAHRADQRRSRTWPKSAEQTPLWHEAAGDAGGAATAPLGLATPIRRLVAALAEPFRETFVLREIQQPVVPRDRRRRRSAGRHRDVPSRARPRHAAIGMDGGRGATANDLRRG